MPTHDCSICYKTETCPIVGIADWVNEHEDEVNGAVRSQAEEISKACDLAASASVSIALGGGIEMLASLVASIFILGYQKGRVFPTVPEVFNKEV